MAAPRKSFFTPKGTELPLLNLKNKEYLQVAHRLVWFREDHPGGILKTQMIALSGEGQSEYAVFKTEVYITNAVGNAVMVSSAHKKETRQGFDDFIEKAETGSIGRALALAGYGTQFASDELDEKDRLADAPLATVGEDVDKAKTAEFLGSKVLPTSKDVKAAFSGNAITEVANTVKVEAAARRPSFRKNVVVVGDDI